MSPRKIGASVFTLTLGLTTIAFSQTTPNRQWSIVTTAQIKPEFRLEFEAGEKEITAAYKKAGLPYRVVVQTLLGDVAEYTSVAPLANFAAMDAASPTVKALGEAGSQRLLKRIGGYATTIHRMAMVSLEDITIRMPEENPGEFAEVTVMSLYPGKGAEFTSFMKDDYLPAMRKADVANLWLSRPIFGGDRSERVMVRPMHKLAELDAGPLPAKALGADGAHQLAVKQSGIVQSIHSTVVRVRPDLSYMPPPQKTKPAAE